MKMKFGKEKHALDAVLRAKFHRDRWRSAEGEPKIKHLECTATLSVLWRFGNAYECISSCHFRDWKKAADRRATFVYAAVSRCPAMRFSDWSNSCSNG